MFKGRILCTEDDPDSRDMLVLTLQVNGYEVVCPVDATAALEIVKKESFDLLLLDTWVTGLSGTDLTREVRKFNQTTPILFYSGVATKPEIQEALNLGAQGYLIKPTGIAQLTDEIAKLIANSRRT
jgi:two-component system KDP operon response regulator KdpE